MWKIGCLFYIGILYLGAYYDDNSKGIKKSKVHGELKHYYQPKFREL